VNVAQARTAVTVTGLRDLKRALTKVAPDLKKEMDKRIRIAIQPVRTKAQGSVPVAPLSGWGTSGQGKWATRLGWNSAVVRQGIKINQGAGRKKGSAVLTAWRISNMNPAGAVYELAGRKSTGDTPQARAFINGLTRSARPSRLIWKAWDEAGGDSTVTPKVLEAIEAAAEELERRAAAAKN
jgi:hypothetical protein